LGARGSPPPGPAFRSFVGGMARLPWALEQACLRAGVVLNGGLMVKGLVRRGGGVVVQTSAGEEEVQAVILAVPPRVAGALVHSLSPAQAELLKTWPTTSVANLSLAFRRDDLPLLPAGSGFVAPRATGTPYSAGTWSSHKWPGRAPQDGVLVRFYFGGARDPDGWKRPEAELVDQALQLLSAFHPHRAPQPLWHRVFRWQDAFAQPEVGHAQRHAALEASSVPGVVLAGGYFAGVGIPDCLARAGQAASLTADFLKNPSDTPIPQGAKT